MFGNNYASSEFILSKVREVTSNAALIKYIENGIKKVDGILRINVINSDRCDFGFKNECGNHFYININCDKVYIYNDTLNFREEVIYDKKQDGIQIEFYGNYRIANDFGSVISKKIEEESFYDSNKKFVFSNSHVEQNTWFNGEIMKRHDLDIKQCAVGDDIVKIENHKSCYHSEFNAIEFNARKCYISEYRNGMYCSVNEDTYEKPLYSEVSGDFSDYEFKIREVEKKHKQNQKSML